jgi:hypothetical protein
VYDSIARARIAGVIVQLVSADDPARGRPFSAQADGNGRFTIPGVSPGRYYAGFFHPALDTLGLEISPRLVEVGSTNLRVDLATPSPRTVMRSVCPTANGDSTGLFMGNVRETEQQAPIAAASVIVDWSEYLLDGVRLYERPRRVTTRTTETGWFAFCGLPSDAVLHARAINAADSSGYVEVEVPARGIRHQTFLVGGASIVTLPADDSATGAGARAQSQTSVMRGSARLSGTILDPAGKPVASAHAVVWGTNLDAQSNDRGAFALEGLPGGTHTVEIRVIGYTPVTRVVHLAALRPATIEVKLEQAAVILATETVRGRLVYSRQLVEFDRRRRSGFGRYLTTEEIARRPNARLSSLLQGMSGVSVQSRTGQSTVVMRGSMGGYCVPTLYVDGNRDLSGDFDYLYSDEIAGVEVYPRESQRPGGYTDSNRCGAILVWTRPRSARVPKDDLTR